MIQDRIPAGGNLQIQSDSAYWRLYRISEGVERLLMEVEWGQSIQFDPTFAAESGLPDAPLAPTLVGRVAVGWSVKDESWHIGFILEPPLSEARGSRWLELAHFPDHDSTLLRETATRTGERLASLINRPFTFVPAKRAALISPPVEIPAPPLNHPLPIKLSGWTLIQRGAAQFDLVRSPGWGRARLLRVLWYMILAGVFLVLAVSSLTSGIALPRLSGIHVEANNQVFVDIPAPSDMTLVIAGFICAALMVIFAAATLIRTITAIKRINIDGEMRQVRDMRGNRPVDSIHASELDSVYASVIVSKFNEDRPSVSRRAHYGELSLRNKAGDFIHLASLNTIDQPIPVTEQSTNADEVVNLTTRTVYTPIHAAALYIARALDVPARLDQRIR